MARRRRVDLRLDPDLVDWADAYALSRASTRTEVIEAGLRSLRDDAERSVPDLNDAVARLSLARDVSGVKRGSDVLADRQRALNKKIQGWS
jgi:hypothetical protein